MAEERIWTVARVWVCVCAVVIAAGVGTAAAVAHRERRSLGWIVLTVAVVGAVLATHEMIFTRGVVAGVLPDDYRSLLNVAGAVDGLGFSSRVPPGSGR